MDNSQTIGYQAKYESFDPLPFPQIITSEDEEYKAIYMSSNDLLEGEKVIHSSISPQRTVEVYKLLNRPQSYKSFRNKLYASVELRMTDSTYNLSNIVFHDKIHTNKDYYYVFRFLNEHGNLGYESPIVHARMIEDGGYKYTIFQDLLAEDLEEDVFINPAISFKKLIQFVPNIQHIVLDTADVDFSDTAFNQLSNINVGDSSVEDSLWDKIFKVRLTSKKTGKKIDLNLKFNQLEEGPSSSATGPLLGEG